MGYIYIYMHIYILYHISYIIFYYIILFYFIYMWANFITTEACSPGGAWKKVVNWFGESSQKGLIICPDLELAMG